MPDESLMPRLLTKLNEIKAEDAIAKVEQKKKKYTTRDTSLKSAGFYNIMMLEEHINRRFIAAFDKLELALNEEYK